MSCFKNYNYGSIEIIARSSDFFIELRQTALPGRTRRTPGITAAAAAILETGLSYRD